MIERFPADIHKEIGFYVYRLIDPRSNKTFYVGKGQGNRLFSHAKGAMNFDKADDDIMPLKIKTIRQIIDARMPVRAEIHRWHLDEKCAYLVESALIDAFDELANQVAGHFSHKHGLINPDDLNALLAKETVVFDENVILLDISRTFSRKNPKRASCYEAARWAWPIDRKRASGIRNVLAHREGSVIAVFDVAEWLDADPANFSDMHFTEKMIESSKNWGRRKTGFRGHLVADGDTASKYLHKRIPAKYMTSQTGVRYAP